MVPLTCLSCRVRVSSIRGGSRARTGREPLVHGLVVLSDAFWSVEDEVGGPVAVANKGDCTSWGLPVHLH